MIITFGLLSVGRGLVTLAADDSSISKESGMAEYNGCPVIRGDYSYPSAHFDKDERDQFFYSDGFFKENATVYDPHLASMSLCLAEAGMSASGENYSNKSVNARELLDWIGCEDICVNEDYVTKPGEDTIGVVIAHKNIRIGGESSTLVPITLRGAGYEQEWIGNMKIGPAEDARGFRDAAKRAKKVVDEYLATYGIDEKKAKFWIAGFSRAGAVTDLLTKSLTVSYDKTGSRVYGYSFATPQGAYEKERTYPNSHCIINVDDSVPKVAPTYMGFSHYGDEQMLTPADRSFEVTRFRVEYAWSFLVKIPNSIVSEPVPDMEMTQEQFIDRLLEAVRNTIAPDRKSFTEKRIEGAATGEEMLSWLMRFLMTSEDSHIKEVMNVIRDAKDHIGADSLFKISDMIDAVEEGIHTFSPVDRETIYANLWSMVRDGLEKVMTQEEFTGLGSIWKSLVYSIFELAHYDFVQGGEEGFVLLGSLMKNVSSIASAHEPETYRTLVREEDVWYKDLASQPVARTDSIVKMDKAESLDFSVSSDGTVVATGEKGKLTASTDNTVCFRSDGLLDDSMKKTEGKTLYRAQTSGEQKSFTMASDRDYEVTCLAADEEGMDFAGWKNEKNEIVSQDRELCFSVNHGKSDYHALTPVYEKSANPSPSPGTPTNGPSWLWWLLGGVTAAGGGTGVFFLWKKKKGV